MNFRRRVLSGAGVLASGQAGAQICAFARNVIIARIISREDFGIAATFIIAISLLEMVSNLAVDRLLVQAEDGDDPRFQRVAHMLQALRGALIALGVFLLAWPVAMLFGIPEVTWAFRCIALVPLLRGFMHLDPKRMHRTMRFGRDAFANITAQVIALAAAWPLAIWLGDYSAVLWLIIMQMGTQVVMSHILAERPYRWAWDRGYFIRIFAFGWPLLINGLLMFGTFQGDRLVVGTGYTMEALGIYSVAFTLTIAPAMMLTKVTATLFLPVLSEAQADEERFVRRYTISLELLLLLACGFAVLFIVAGRPLVVLIFSEKYAAAGILVMWLGAMQSVRLLRTTQANASIARADTTTVMFSNVIRALAIGGMAAVAVAGLELYWIAACGLGGEIAAYFYAMFRLRSRCGIPFEPSLRAACVLGVTCALAVAAADLAGTEVGPTMLALLAAGFAALAINTLTSAGLRGEFARALRRAPREHVIRTAAMSEQGTEDPAKAGAI